MVILVLGVFAFVFTVSTRAHHRACERLCGVRGERYAGDFAFAPWHTPPCNCVLLRPLGRSKAGAGEGS